MLSRTSLTRVLCVQGLVNNFVGREKERPDLTISDFPAQDDDDEEPPVTLTLPPPPEC